MAALPIIGILGSLFQAGGALAAGQAKYEAAKRMAELYKEQGIESQRRLDQMADDVVRISNFAAERAKLRGRTDVGAYRTQYASSGVDVTTGTAEHVQLRGLEIAHAEEYLLRDNGQRQALEYTKQGGYEMRMAELKGEAAMRGGDAARMGSYFSAAGSVLGGLDMIEGDDGKSFFNIKV